MLIVTSISAQAVWENLPFRDYADYKLQPLNKSLINTGILYDRVFPAAEVQRFKQINQTTDTSSPEHWNQAYYEMYNAAYNTSGWQTPDALQNAIQINPSLPNGIPIGVMLFNYNVMDSNALAEHLIDTSYNGQYVDVANRPRSPYFTQQLSIASPLVGYEEEIYTETDYVFYVDPTFLKTNQNLYVNSVTVSFSDGTSYVINDPFSSSQTLSLKSFVKRFVGNAVQAIGRININFTLFGQTYQVGNPFRLFLKTPKPYLVTNCEGGMQWIIEADPGEVSRLSQPYGNPTVAYTRKLNKQTINVKDTAYFFFSPTDCSAKQVKRPIIFIDGLDPGNSRLISDIYWKKINITIQRNGQTRAFGEYMLSQGYQFIILDFKGGADLVERNAMTLVALIQRLNATYGSQYVENITLIGPSMGSLVAQYALAYMEKNGITHRVKNFISFDGNHQGANVPIGIQNMVEYVGKRGILANANFIKNGLYNSPGAKQLLVHHVSANSEAPQPDNFRNLFLSGLNSVGEYPQSCRKVAILNGAGNGTLNSTHASNPILLRVENKPFINFCNDPSCKMLSWTASITASTGRTRVTDMVTRTPVINLLLWTGFGRKEFFAQPAFGNSAYDNAPGGLFGDRVTDLQILDANALFNTALILLGGGRGVATINVNNFTMVPSHSAADIRYPVKNLYRRIDQCPPTPFNHIYAPQANEEHISVTPVSSFWFENEIRGNYPAPQNPTPPGLNMDFTSPQCDVGVAMAYLPNSTCYDWETTGDLIINGGGSTLTCGSPYVSISSTGGQGGTIRVRAQLGACYSATQSVCFRPCQPWEANFRWINAAPSTNEPLIAEVDAFDEATSYRWFVDGMLIETTSGPYLHTYNWPCTYGRLTVMAVNPCGKSEIIDGDYYFPNCYMYGSYVQVYPNPASNETTVSLKEDKSVNSKGSQQAQRLSSFTKLKIISKDGALQREWRFSPNTKTARLNISGLRPDVYYVVVSDGKTEVRTTLSVQR